MTWVYVNAALIYAPPEWFHRDMWISDGTEVFIGKYTWQQGWHPDRLVSDYCGNVSALNGFYVMELVYPCLPLVEKI